MAGFTLRARADQDNGRAGHTDCRTCPPGRRLPGRGRQRCKRRPVLQLPISAKAARVSIAIGLTTAAIAGPVAVQGAPGAAQLCPMRVGPHTLHHGDCLAVMPTLAAQAFDVVVTSPPYNLDLAYDAYHDKLDEGAYLDWMMAVCAQVRRVLAPDGSFFLNISGSNSRPWLPFELIVRLRTLFVLQNHITWIKSIATADDSVGHFKPLAGARFLNHNHEHIFHLTLDGTVKLDRLAIGVPFKDKSNIARRNHARDMRCRGNTWFIPYRTVQARAGKFNHPGTFPVDLPRWCIRLHGRAGAAVLDPFMGTGTTVVAAELEGAVATGIELDAGYRAIAAGRAGEALAAEPGRKDLGGACRPPKPPVILETRLPPPPCLK